MEMSKLRMFVQTQLATLNPESYYGVAGADATHPYLVYNIEEVSRIDNLSVMELEVSVVDYGLNTEPAEALADRIQADFDHLYAINDDFQAAFYCERRQPIFENDKNVIRRRLTFQVRVCERR